MTEHEALLQRRHRLRDLLHRREKNYKGSKERLAYYRSHGLTDCSDYPGGDAAFKRDVLAGDQRQEKDFTFDTKREDTYIIKCLKDGRFKPDADFTKLFPMHPKIFGLSREAAGCLHLTTGIDDPVYHVYNAWSPDYVGYKKKG